MFTTLYSCLAVVKIKKERGKPPLPTIPTETSANIQTVNYPHLRGVEDAAPYILYPAIENSAPKGSIWKTVKKR